MASFVDPVRAAENSPGIRIPGQSATGGSWVDHLALEWLDRDPAPRLILGRDLSIRWRNHSATAFLQDDPGICLGDDMLRVEGRANQERLVTFMATVVSGSLYLHWEERDDFLLFRAEHLPASIDGQTLAVTVSSRRWVENTIRFSDLEVAFRLTPREVEIVTLLAQGNNVVSIGVHVDCAMETVRRHVKNIYTKIGVSTREELLNRVYPFRQRS